MISLTHVVSGVMPVCQKDTSLYLGLDTSSDKKKIWLTRDHRKFPEELNVSRFCSGGIYISNARMISTV